MYYVYVLQWKKNSALYIGSTNNLIRRIREHQKKESCRLIYYEAYLSEKTIREREKKLKHYGSAWRALKKRITA